MIRTTAEIEHLIRTAYQATTYEPGAWVSLTRLREEIGDVNRHEVDAAMVQMSDVDLIPESNQKILKLIDWDCAVWIGGQWSHLIRIT